MSFGEPKMPTPEEIAKERKETIKEAMAGGAEYVMDESTDQPRLEFTKEQIDAIEAEEQLRADKLAIKTMTESRGVELEKQGEHPSITIESMDDLKEEMKIMIDDTLGSVVEGTVAEVNTDPGFRFARIEFPVKKKDPNRGEYTEKYAVRLSLDNPKSLELLKQLNNVPEAPWMRYEVGQEVKIPRSTGAVSLATIESFNQKGQVFVTWNENGVPLRKILPVSELDKANQ